MRATWALTSTRPRPVVGTTSESWWIGMGLTVSAPAPLAGCVPPPTPETTMSTIQEGSPAADFALENQDGTRLEAADLAGSPYVLWFYPKADTPG